MNTITRLKSPTSQMVVAATIFALCFLLTQAVFAGHNPDLSTYLDKNNIGDGSFENPFISTDKVPLCHSTGSGYSTPNPSLSSFFGVGGGRGHDQDADDIIPPFHYKLAEDADTLGFSGTNWDDEHIAIFENGCKSPDPDPATLIIQKQFADGTEPVAFETFSYKINGGDATPFDSSDGVNEEEVTEELEYTVTEVEIEGYTPSYEGCEGVIAPGDGEVVCTITNTFVPPVVPGCTDSGATNFDPKATTDDGSCEYEPGLGVLIVKKNVVGGSAATSSFSFQIDGGGSVNFDDDGVNVFTGMATGTYTVTEDSATDYDATLDNCTNFVIAANATTTCEITNTFNPTEPPRSATGTIEVRKVVTGTTSSQSFDFTGSLGAFTLANGESTSTDLEATTSPYSVSETVPSGWTLESAVCVYGDQSTSSPSSIVLSENETVVCTFTNAENGTTTPGDFRLDVTIIGNGSGTITDDTEGIFCFTNGGAENDCTETYASGTVVTLMATPDEGSNFDSSWTVGTGTCTGTTTPCTVVMNQNQSLTAHFALNGGGGGSCISNCGGGGGGGKKIELQERGGSSSSDEEPVPEVLGEQVSVVPVGAPNTGAGGTAPSGTLPSVFALLGLFASLFGIRATRNA